MWKLIKRLTVGVGVLLVVIVAGTAAWIYFGVLGPIDEHFDGDCQELPLAGSGEDILVDGERGMAYLSVMDRGGVAAGADIEDGAIMRVDLTQDPPAAETALLSQPDDFRPHGMSLFIDESGQRHLFMINHPENRGVDEELVEHYREVEPGQYEYVETFRSPLVVRPNDLVAVGPRQVYVAQDTGQARDAPEFTDLVYFDAGEATVVADDIRSGGGINVSQDGSTIYVAETNAQSIRVFQRNPDDGSVIETGNIPLGGSPDNVDVAADGSLWVGIHSNLPALILHFIIGTDAPTQILRVQAEDGSIEEIYLNSGAEITSGSVGVSHENLLLIGSITDKKILICRRNSV